MSNLFSPHQAYDKAIENATEQMNAALAAGQRRFSLPLPNGPAFKVALEDKGWTVRVESAPEGAVLILSDP